MRDHLLVLVAAAAALPAQAPAGYYSSVVTTSATALRSSLHAVIDDHTRLPYTSTATDTWNVVELADQNPSNTSTILDLYKNAAYTKVNGGTGPYDREHSWPKSYGFPNDGSTNYPYTDCHHLFCCDSSYNSTRSNKPYAIGASTWTEKTTLVNNGAGGGSGVFPGNSNWSTGGTNTGSWQTWGNRKGDVARALMYLDVRYEGGTHGITGVAEPNLILTDDTNLIQASNTGANLTTAYMGLKSVLVQWHNEDPVDSKEIARNNAVFAYQGNRNPFIDNPQWVACLFGSSCGTPPPATTPWINELHYDNNGTDSNELVEVAGAAGTSLSGWKLVAYNGSDGTSYATVNLSGTIPSLQNGYGVVSFAFAGLQNGAPDGVALINASNQVVQFLSYEGSFTATNGAATGMTATNIGVGETSTSTVGFSLQLGGSGHSYASFTWQNVLDDTPGAVNRNQTLQ
jgi:endonuclease I